MPAALPIKGWLSIRIKVYSESSPCIWIPSPPPKSETVIKPSSSLITSDNLVAFIFSISPFFMIDAFSGSDERTLSVFVAVTITSSRLLFVESILKLDG